MNTAMGKMKAKVTRRINAMDPATCRTLVKLLSTLSNRSGDPVVAEQLFITTLTGIGWSQGVSAHAKILLGKRAMEEKSNQGGSI